MPGLAAVAGVLGWQGWQELKVDMDREEAGRPVSWETLLRNCLFSTEREEGRGLMSWAAPPPHWTACSHIAQVEM